MACGGSPDNTAIGQLQASNRTLHVGGLHRNTTEDELLEALGGTQAGIQSIRIARDFESQVSFGYARVEYTSEEFAQKAIETYNFKTLRGRQLRLSLYKCIRDRSGTGETKIFIKNLETNVSERQLFDRLRTLGQRVETCQIYRHEKTGVSRGYGAITYSSAADAAAAIEALNGTKMFTRQISAAPFMKRDPPAGQTAGASSSGGGGDFTSLHVSNIGPSTGDRELRDMFEKFGAVSSARVLVSASGEPRGRGFVSFQDHQAAARALESFADSTTLRVAPAKSRSERQAAATRSLEARSGFTWLVVRNLDGSVTDTTLSTVFSSFGKLVHAKVVVAVNGIHCGYGYVQFESAEAAQKALSLYDTRHFEQSWVIEPMTAKPPELRIKATAEEVVPDNGMSFDPASVNGLLVHNIGLTVTDDTLRKVFGFFGNVVHAEVVTRHGAHCGFGMVQFDSSDAMRRVMEADNARYFDSSWVIRPRTLKIVQQLDTYLATEASPEANVTLPPSCDSDIQHISLPPSKPPKVRGKFGHMMGPYMKDVGEFGHLSDGGSFDSVDLDYDENPEISAEAGTMPDAHRDEDIRRERDGGGGGGRREGGQRVRSRQVRSPSPSMRSPAPPVGRSPARSTERSQVRQAGASQSGPTVRSAERSEARPAGRSVARSAAQSAERSADRSVVPRSPQSRRGRAAAAAAAASQARPRPPPQQQASQRAPDVHHKCAPTLTTDNTQLGERAAQKWPVSLEDQFPTTLGTAPKSPVEELAEDVASAASKEEKLRILGNFMYLALHDRYDCEGATGLLVAKFVRLDDVEKLMSMCRDKVLLFTEAEAAATTLRLAKFYSDVTVNSGAVAGGSAAGVAGADAQVAARGTAAAAEGTAAAAGSAAAAAGGTAAAAGGMAAVQEGAAAAASATGRAAPGPLPKASAATVNSKASRR